MLSRLLEAHAIVIAKVRDALEAAAASADEGTVDLLTSDVLRLHEIQVWFLAEHLVPSPPFERDKTKLGIAPECAAAAVTVSCARYGIARSTGHSRGDRGRDPVSHQ